MLSFGTERLTQYQIKSKEGIPSDCYYIENFVEKYLKLDSSVILNSLNKLPIWRLRKNPENKLVGNGNWINPNYPFMGFRGNDLNRMKCFFYDSSLTAIPKYYYTGFQYASMFSYQSTTTCPIVQTILNKCSSEIKWRENRFKFNQVIVTKYRNYKDSIGSHQDKPNDIKDNSPILILTLCEKGNERTMQLTTQDDRKIWTKDLKNGSLLILGDKSNGTYKGGLKNQEVKHEILESRNKSIGERVSLVLRDITTLISKDKVESYFQKHVLKIENKIFEKQQLKINYEEYFGK